MPHDFEVRRESVLQTPELVAFWDFQSPDFTSVDANRLALQAVRASPKIETNGVFGLHCLRFQATGTESRGFLRARAQDAPQLSIGGVGAQVSVVAWLKRAKTDYTGCQFVAGVWNEHGRRQYGMFLNLKIWDSSEQIGAHVSSHGGATPGFPYCMDAAIGATRVDFEQWHCAAMSYDGKSAKVFLDGVLDFREPQSEPGSNPFSYPAGLLAGNADFTVGAVERPAKVIGSSDGTFTETGALMANPFVGCLGGLAVFRRALSDSEMLKLATSTSADSESQI